MLCAGLTVANRPAFGVEGVKRGAASPPDLRRAVPLVMAMEGLGPLGMGNARLTALANASQEQVHASEIVSRVKLHGDSQSSVAVVSDVSGGVSGLSLDGLAEHGRDAEEGFSVKIVAATNRTSALFGLYHES